MSRRPKLHVRVRDGSDPSPDAHQLRNVNWHGALAMPTIRHEIAPQFDRPPVQHGGQRCADATGEQIARPGP